MSLRAFLNYSKCDVILEIFSVERCIKVNNLAQRRLKRCDNSDSFLC